MDNIVAIKTNCYKDFDFYEALTQIRNAGFNYIELSASSGLKNPVGLDKSFSELCAIKNKLKELDLIPVSLGGHMNIMDEANIPDFIDKIRLAHFFGCRYIVTSVGDAHKEEDYIISNEEIAKHIQVFIPYLNEYDMTLVIELHGYHSTGKIVSEICRLSDSERVKINYDTGNAIFWGELDSDEMIDDFEKCISDVGYMHLKDKLGDKKEWNFPALGKGYIPLDKIIDILKQNNNSSCLSVEIEFTPEGVKDIDEVNQAVKDSADYLSQLGLKL